MAVNDIVGFFDKLHFSESVLGPVRIEGTQLRVPVGGVFLLTGHPLESDGYGPYHGELIFDGVVDSRRSITEYIGDPRKPEGFKPPREVVDALPIKELIDETVFQEFGFEGYQESPSAWIDNWIVRAKSFMFRVQCD
jgi:hypothetical protein